MELDHFSHEHPLKLIDKAQNDVDSEEKLLCDGCRQQIVGSAYNCNECKYILHEKCAKLPKQINHPMHLEHTLTLHASPPYEYNECTCTICQIKEWKWFTYHCSICEFDIHVSCALQEDSIVKHEGHHHPLTFVHRPSSFFCDACRTVDRYLKEPTEFSYRCSTCPFWIHKTCATSPSTIKHSEHEHKLDLAYALPEIHRKFKQFCYICRERVHPTGWIYYCGLCRYFLHLKCARGEKIPSILLPIFDESYVPLNMRGSKAYLDPDLMKFPLPDNSMDLISRFVKSFSRGDNEMARELIHPTHKHPLLLSDIQSDIDVLCDGCRRPISIPFYSCEQCNDFFLHKCCAELPEEIQHSSHQEHTLSLYKSPYILAIEKCKGCERFSSEFFYRCSTSDRFCLDVQCASLPKGINHDSHNHSLQLEAKSFGSKCSGCGERRDGHQYKCAACGFNICSHCASLPRTFKHEWDHHQLALSYPPFSYHPDEFICEVCEEFIHPNYWLYHCRQCDQSFHTKCIKPSDQFSNVKFGGTIKDEEIHEHPLVFVRKSTIKSHSGCCDKCGRGDPDSWPVLECAPCNFQWCSCRFGFDIILMKQQGYKLRLSG